MPKIKVVAITCYKDPDYVRARTLRSGLQELPDVNTEILKNKHKGLLRYPEIIWGLIKIRRNFHPDVYLLTFRGQEILPFVLLIAGRKPVIFDEFIVPLAWANDENHKPTLKNRFISSMARFSAFFYRQWLASCRFILTDTTAHAENSARLSGVNSRSYRVVPVGTDETLFTPGKSKPFNEHSFKVFFYGSMLPLHGIQYVIDAAVLLKDEHGISFEIVGGGKDIAKAVIDGNEAGGPLEYKKWIPFEELPAAIRDANLCLGGPFGDTSQSRHVVTGKTYQFLACQVPTVVGETDVSGLFEDKQNTLVVPQADAQALAKSIVWAYKHPSELKTIAERGRRLYESSFSIAIIAKELKSLLSELT